MKTVSGIVSIAEKECTFLQTCSSIYTLILRDPFGGTCEIMSQIWRGRTSNLLDLVWGYREGSVEARLHVGGGHKALEEHLGLRSLLVARHGFSWDPTCKNSLCFIHEGIDGHIEHVTATELLMVYPDELGFIWEVDLADY